MQKCDALPGHRTVSVRCREIRLVNNGNVIFFQEGVTDKEEILRQTQETTPSSCSRSASAEGPPTKQINILGARQLCECRRGRST